MTQGDRVMCGLLKCVLAGRGAEVYEPWLRDLLSGSGQSHDWVDREYLLPLLQYVRAGE